LICLDSKVDTPMRFPEECASPVAIARVLITDPEEFSYGWAIAALDAQTRSLMQQELLAVGSAISNPLYS